ncbi:hypothetical protein BRADI_4g10064v3 [Brachypodium distachyon]|uniref:Uncharacterized protein n=1 Tax=Brachypodium distachyon TaxID=15368 RepID=A0A0Q3L3U0_BRADI|nr:hypothetical protein BRADI_4g10064v3 [Brachypodium distachyon]
MRLIQSPTSFLPLRPPGFSSSAKGSLRRRAALPWPAPHQRSQKIPHLPAVLSHPPSKPFRPSLRDGQEGQNRRRSSSGLGIGHLSLDK